jgi:hypothetical protein
MKPTEAAKAIEAALPFKFTSGLFTKSWKSWACVRRLDMPIPSGRTTSTATTTSVTRTTATRRPTWPRSSGNATRNKSVEVSWTQRRETKETGAWVGEPPPRPPWAKKKLSSDGDHEDSFSILSGLANDTGPSVLTHGL